MSEKRAKNRARVLIVDDHAGFRRSAGWTRELYGTSRHKIAAFTAG